jgi:hypothetical protein
VGERLCDVKARGKKDEAVGRVVMPLGVSTPLWEDRRSLEYIAWQYRVDDAMVRKMGIVAIDVARRRVEG